MSTFKGQFSELLGKAADREAVDLAVFEGSRGDVLGFEVQVVGAGAIVGGTRPVVAADATNVCD